MIVLGYVLASATFVFLVLVLKLSFDTEGGAIGQVPVMAWAVAVPMLGTMALFVLSQEGAGLAVPAWGYPVVFVFSILVIGWLLSKLGQLKARSKGRSAGR